MRMKFGWHFWLCLTALCSCILWGCSKEEKPRNSSDAKTEVAKSLESLSPEDVLVQVGKCKLTKGEYDTRLKFKQAFAKILNPSPKEEDRKKIEENIKSGIVTSFIQESYIQNSLDEYVATNGPLPEATAETAKREITLLYEEEDDNGRSRKLDAIEKALDAAGVGDIFRENLRRECRTEQFLQSYRPDFMIVDGITVTNFMFGHEMMSAVATVTNESIMATAKAVLQRAKDGEDFADLADEFSMDPTKDSGGYIGECTSADFGGEEEIFAKIDKLDSGGVTDLIDADDSLRIYKVLERVPAEKSESGQPSLRLSRIYFRKAVVMPPFTEEEIVHELYRARRKTISKILLDEAMRRDAVTFPNGWKIFPGDTVKKFMVNIEETVRPGGENPYLTPQERAMRASGAAKRRKNIIDQKNRKQRRGVR